MRRCIAALCAFFVAVFFVALGFLVEDSADPSQDASLSGVGASAVSSAASTGGAQPELRPFSEHPTLSECRGLVGFSPASSDADHALSSPAAPAGAGSSSPAVSTGTASTSSASTASAATGVPSSFPGTTPSLRYAQDCIHAIPAPDLAGSLLAVGVTTFEQAQRAVDAGVRHLFFGTGADFSIFNGQGDPTRSVAALQQRAGGGVVISVDEEGGEVQRLSSLVGAVPSARDMAATLTPQQVRDLMFDHGKKMRALGITMDFAPVADVAFATGAANSAIGSRSYSADPQVVAQYVEAFSQGLLDAGITPVLKHFPGHGRATGDSHQGAVSSPALDQMRQVDMLPFARVSGMPGVAIMVGHIQTPGLDAVDGSGAVVQRGADTPASVNPAAYGLLRQGGYSKDAAGKAMPAPFGGLIITDDVTGMRAISDVYSGPQAAVAALVAGADQALMASGAVDVEDTVVAVRQAIRDGRIPAEHVYSVAAWGWG